MANMYIVTGEELAATADSIREKTGTTAQLEWEENNGFKSIIEAMPSGKTIEVTAATGTVIPPVIGAAVMTDALPNAVEVVAASGNLQS